MPSELPISTIDSMLSAGAAAAWSRKQTADVHPGGGYDCQAGVGALLWIREQHRDIENFRRSFTDTSVDSGLEWRIVQMGGPARIDSTRGAGTAQLLFAPPPGGSGTAGTLWTGTRIAITGIGTTPRYYRIAADTAIAATQTGAIVPIEAETMGTGVAINTQGNGGIRLSWEDSIFNTGWTVVSIQCADGTDRETDTEYRARWRQGKLDRRAGYAKSISDAFVAAGARYVVLLESDFIVGGDDYGINRAFVADATYQSSPGLLRACRLAADSARVLGCDLTVWGITRVAQAFDLTVNLWDQPGNFNTTAIRTAVQDGVLHYFSSRANGFIFKRDGLQASVMQACQEVQSLTFGGGDPTDVVIASIMASTALPLLYTDRSLISVTIAGPV